MNNRSAFGIAITVLALIIALLHFLANMYYLYFYWWWADIVMHFLGGMFIAGSTLWLISYEVPDTLKHLTPPFLSAFVVIILVGIGWEIFEKVFDAHTAINYALDTALDMITNIAGMMTAYLIFSKYEQ